MGRFSELAPDLAAKYLGSTVIDVTVQPLSGQRANHGLMGVTDDVTHLGHGSQLLGTPLGVTARYDDLGPGISPCDPANQAPDITVGLLGDGT